MKMVGKSIVPVLIAASLCFSQSETLSNEKVIKMAQAGISEQLVLKQTESDTPGLDLSADALISLKKAGVPYSVIEAMFNSAGASNSPYREPRLEERQSSSRRLSGTERERFENCPRQTRGSAGSPDDHHQKVFPSPFETVT